MAGGRLAIIAGGGDLPRRLAEHAKISGRDPFVLGVAGFADPAFVAAHGGVHSAYGEIGRSIDLLKAAGVTEIVFAGTVKKPDISALKFDVHGLRLVPKLIAAAAKGDDALLRVVVDAYEKAGFRVIGADAVLADLLAPPGAFGANTPHEADWADIRVAAKTASEIGADDIGQGAVARNGSVVATETQAGTDAMLARVASMLNLHATGGVLVKRPKPGQERRIDLPTIGVSTVTNAAAAGLAGIAVEAGGALVLDRAAVARAADEHGLFVYGFRAEELA
jgi:DUF1009 family protein